MPSILHPLGNISYNDFAFSPFTQTRVGARNVYDRAGRTVVAVQLRFDLNTTLTPGDNQGDNPLSTDSDIDDLITRLSQPQKHLLVQNMGLGDIDVGGSDSTQIDVAYGPKPEVQGYTPVVAPMAWALQWSCTTTLPLMCFDPAYKSKLMAFNFTWEVVIDDHGFSTVMIDGYAEIPATRIDGDRKLPDNADKYWESILTHFPQLNSFRRTARRRLSDDKRTIHFSITYRELTKNCFLTGITDWDGDHEVTTGAPNQLRSGITTLSATYHVARDQPKNIAGTHFFALLNSRLNAGRPKWTQKIFLPLGFRIHDKITSQEVSFSLSYQHNIATLNDLVTASGMWVSLGSESNWQAWQTSLKDTAANARGNAQLFFDPATDSVIDLCLQNAPPINSKYTKKDTGEKSDMKGWRPEKPTEDQSWLRYVAWTTFDGDTNTMVSKPLVESSELRTVNFDFLQKLNPKVSDKSTLSGGVSINAAQQAGFAAGSGAGSALTSVPPGSFALGGVPGPTVGAGLQNNQQPQTPDVIQQRVNPSAYVTLHMLAVRAGFRIPLPTLLSFGGVTPVLIKPYKAEKVIADFGMPIIVSYCRSVYYLPSLPDSPADLAFNPVLS